MQQRQDSLRHSNPQKMQSSHLAEQLQNNEQINRLSKRSSSKSSYQNLKNRIQNFNEDKSNEQMKLLNYENNENLNQ